jgi:hypothetical protein
MRVISTSVRAALIILALFWGNCLTCPQALMAQTHRCCHKNKQGSQSCQTQVLRQFVKADPAPHAAPVPVVAELSSLPLTVPVAEWTSLPNASEHAPPDLFSLHSSYRI